MTALVTTITIMASQLLLEERKIFLNCQQGFLSFKLHSETAAVIAAPHSKRLSWIIMATISAIHSF